MTTTLHPVPRRGTALRRAWNLRAAIIGGLPLATVLLCLAALFTTGRVAAGAVTPWPELAGWAFGAWVAVTVVAFIALFDARTRVVAAASLVVALLINPLTMALLQAVVGL